MYRDNTSITANLNYSSIMFSMINYVGTTWNTLMFYEQFQQSLSHLLLKVSCLYYVKWKQKYITIKMQRYCSTRVSSHCVHYLPSFAFHWLWFFAHTAKLIIQTRVLQTMITLRTNCKVCAVKITNVTFAVSFSIKENVSFIHFSETILTIFYFHN